MAEECARCNGTGSIETTSRQDHHGGGGYSVIRSCEVCGGTGRIADHLDLEGQALLDHLIAEHEDEHVECTYGEVLDVLKAIHIRQHEKAS